MSPSTSTLTTATATPRNTSECIPVASRESRLTSRCIASTEGTPSPSCPTTNWTASSTASPPSNTSSRLTSTGTVRALSAGWSSRYLLASATTTVRATTASTTTATVRRCRPRTMALACRPRLLRWTRDTTPTAGTTATAVILPPTPNSTPTRPQPANLHLHPPQRSERKPLAAA